MTKHETAEQALEVLKAIDAGTVKVFLAHAKQDTYCNNVDYVTDNGWKFTVFIDCGEWDYIDHLSSPTGGTLEFSDTEMPDWMPQHEEYWLEAKVTQ